MNIPKIREKVCYGALNKSKINFIKFYKSKWLNQIKSKREFDFGTVSFSSVSVVNGKFTIEFSLNLNKINY